MALIPLSIRMLYVAVCVAGVSTIHSNVDTARNQAGFISRSLDRKFGGDGHILRRQTDGTLHVETIDYLGVTVPIPTIDLAIGTPPQNVSVELDTGSSVFYVNVTCSGWTGDTLELCRESQFDPRASRTATNLSFSNVQVYGNGVADVSLFSDVLKILGPDVNLRNATVYVASKTVGLFFGILGIGLDSGLGQYPNVIGSLQSQGLTNSRAFGLGLGDIHKNEGSIVFGGLDTKKFAGNLTTLPLQVLPGLTNLADQNHYAVTLESLGLDLQGQKKLLTSGNLTVGLDSGTSISILPSVVTLEILSALNATFGYFPNFIAVDCKLRQLNATFDFAFPGGLTIRVPFAHFILPPQEADDTLCMLGATTTAGSTLTPDQAVILGDTFLQDAYVVFDQTNLQVSMAQYINCGTNERALPAAATAINHFVGEC